MPELLLAAQSEHDPERLRDSGSLSMRIRFLVHTEAKGQLCVWSANNSVLSNSIGFAMMEYARAN
jgi:hypothetical protein